MKPEDASTRYDRRPKTVFVSHTHADRELATEIRRRLTEAGVDVWSAEEKIQVGGSLRQGIEEGLRASDAAVVILSDAAQTAPGTSMELASLIAGGASRGHPRLLPVLAERGAEVPPFLADLLYADASRPKDAMPPSTPSCEPYLRTGRTVVLIRRHSSGTSALSNCCLKLCGASTRRRRRSAGKALDGYWRSRWA